MKPKKVILFLGVLWAPLCGLGVPSNDNFENRIVLTGDHVVFSGTLFDATIEPGEPGLSPYNPATNASVWWSWTAPRTGPAVIEVTESSGNALMPSCMTCWTGTDLNQLVLVGYDGLYFDTRPPLYSVINAIAGTTYNLRVMGTNFGDFGFKLTQTNAPVIIVQPRSRTVTAGESVFFGCLAAGATTSTPKFTYQWKFNGADLQGETAAILMLDNVTAAQTGGYTVQISNSMAGVISQEANLAVNDGRSRPQLLCESATVSECAFRIAGDLGRFYVVESSTNLMTWSEEKAFPREFRHPKSAQFRERNGIIYNDGGPVQVASTAPGKFFRVRPYVPYSAQCENNLAAIRFANDCSALESGFMGMTTVEETVAYFRRDPNPPNTWSGGPGCPLGGTMLVVSYVVPETWLNPICMFARDHVLRQPEY